MRHSRRRSSLAVFVIIIAAACAAHRTLREHADTVFDAFRSAASEAIADPDRRAAAERITGDMQQVLMTGMSDIDKHRIAMFEINADYDATRAQLEEQLEQFAADKHRVHELLIVDIMQLRGIMTAQEWQSAFEAMEPYREQ